MSLTIGVLALQGAFEEHIDMLKRLGVNAVEVRLPSELEGLDGLIFPGGESTAIAKVAERWGMVRSICSFIASYEYIPYIECMIID